MSVRAASGSPRRPLLRRLRRDRKGATAVETAIVFPVFIAMVIGTFDIGYLLYNRAMLSGLVSKAARDSTIEQNIGAAATQIDQEVRDSLLIGAQQATVNFSRESFSDFTSAARPEPFSDGNNNGTCDNGEAFEDHNDNDIWDSGGVSGQGGARDIVVYRVDLEYPRLVPLAGLFGLSDTVSLTSQTVVANQPFGEQQQRDVSMGNCS